MSSSEVAWFDSSAFDAHITGRGHPERKERLTAVRDGLANAGLDTKLLRPAPTPVARAVLEAVHTPTYVAALERACAAGGGHLDLDTAVVEASWNAALLAAGAAVDATFGVLRGDFRRAFCSVRPPGHHALADQAMGFCLFDNVAVAAQAAITAGLVRRVAIVDWDVHHGNGTQDIFWQRSDVLYASTHQFPFYPGTGAITEVGEGPGRGATVNCPLPLGSGDEALLQAWETRIRPALEDHEPELLLISAGFDANARDPLGGLAVTTSGFATLSETVIRWADAHCQGRVISVLEGGYDLTALAADTAAHVATMM